MSSQPPDLIMIDRDSSVPIYVQISERVRALVSVGTLKPGDRLPSIRAVAQHLRVDYNTVAHAYGELDREGIIQTARGVGTHVTGSASTESLEKARQARLAGTVGTMVDDLLELGYTADEIREALDAYLDSSERGQ